MPLLSTLGRLFGTKPATPPATRPDPVNPPLRDRGFPVRHIETFTGLVGTVAKTYRWQFDEALRNSPENARAMRRDGWLIALLRERQMPSARSKWHVEPEDDHDPRQVAAAALVTQILQRTPRFSRLRMKLLEAIWYGRYAAQLALAKDRVRGRVCWGVRAWLPVHGDKLVYRWDGTPGVLIQSTLAQDYRDRGATVLQTDRGSALFLDAPAWRCRFLLHSHEIDDADWREPDLAGGVEGVGLRHHAYWLWWLRYEVQSWLLDYLNRVGAGGLTIVSYQEGNPENLLKARAVANDLQTGNVILVPVPQGTNVNKQVGVERLEPSQVGSQILIDIIDKQFESKLERLFVGQTASSRSETSGLGTHDTDLQADTKYQLIALDSEALDESLSTDLVMPLLRWNVPGADFRLLFKSDLSKPDPAAQLEAVEKAYGIGVGFKEDEVRALTGLSAPQPGDKALKQQAPPAGGMPGMPGLPGAGPPPNRPPPRPDLPRPGLSRPPAPGAGPGRARFAKDKGRWVTIGGTRGEDGERHGGSPVYIENGRITKGHPSLTGKKIGALGGEGGVESKQKLQPPTEPRGHKDWGKLLKGMSDERLSDMAGRIVSHVGEQSFADQVDWQAANYQGLHGSGLQNKPHALRARAALETLASELANKEGQRHKALAGHVGQSSGHFVSGEMEKDAWETAWDIATAGAASDDETAPSRRAENKQAAEYTRAKAAKQARREGIRPADLHQLAAEVKAHHDAYAADRRQLLRDAREALSEFGGQAKALHLLAGRGGDAASIRGMDEVAEDLARRHPHLFPEDEHASDVLYGLLTGATPQDMPEADAYEQALEHLREHRHAGAGYAPSEEPIPFAKGGDRERFARDAAGREHKGKGPGGGQFTGPGGGGAGEGGGKGRGAAAHPDPAEMSDAEIGAELRTARGARLAALRAEGGRRMDAAAAPRAAAAAPVDPGDPEALAAAVHAAGRSLPGIIGGAAYDPDAPPHHRHAVSLDRLYHALKGRLPPGTTAGDFKAALLAAHQAGALELRRADLVPAMDPEEVKRSELEHFGATFHLVSLPAARERFADDGGGDDWVSAKIKKLKGEGYPQDQAVAIALSMAREKGIKGTPPEKD